MDGMDREMKEPAATIRAELARRRMTVGRLVTATGISYQTLRRRLERPDEFSLAELAAIATVLEIDPEALYALWAADTGAVSA